MSMHRTGTEYRRSRDLLKGRGMSHLSTASVISSYRTHLAFQGSQSLSLMSEIKAEHICEKNGSNLDTGVECDDETSWKAYVSSKMCYMSLRTLQNRQ
jgi:hypothetical protein